MKKYKVLVSIVVFAIGKQEYIGNKGDILELPEDHITTRALQERKRIEEVKGKKAGAPESDETPKK